LYQHGYGYVAPNQTMNLGADFAVTPKLVLTTRFGYFFENYHDFGYPTAGSLFTWLTPGVMPQHNGPPVVVLDHNGQPLPQSLQQIAGYFSTGNDQTYTLRNANKHHQFDQDVAWFKGGLLGTHNFKFGYQLNHVFNDIFQHWNAPAVQLTVGKDAFYGPAGTTGNTNCDALAASQLPTVYGGCTGQYGFVTVQDLGSLGKASSYNHSFYAQDAWQIGRGLTLNVGVRVEKESLPSETQAGGFPSTPINFGWGDKIAPRLGAAWDVFRDGKLKLFGSYGVYNDLMKLNLAISSFGGQYWQNCFYALDTADLSSINVQFGPNQRYCSGDSKGGANFAGGVVPAGLTFLENQNFRGTEGVGPGLKPYRQHETVFGTDYAITKTLAFEARWDRRRLDRAIEDSAIFASDGSETFLIVNPGFGPNATNLAESCTTDPRGCPPNIKAARSYDGLEFRLTKATTRNWFGMFSYTYSHLRGNYSGLTSTDLADGGGGRNAPNNSRAFDESFFQYDANGRSSSGPLGTDRPHALKGYAYYRIPWKSTRMTSNIGWFQTLYSGTPLSTYTDVGFSFAQPPFSGGFPVYPEDRGKFARVSIAPNADGVLVPTVTSICDCRTPWYVQSDASFKQEFKVNKNNEAQVLTFEANVLNLFNRQSATGIYSQLDSAYFQSFLNPGGQFSYAAFEHPYDWKGLLSNTTGLSGSQAGPPLIPNSQYGKPFIFQTPRSMRLAVRFTF
jgi:hypothetical protein